MKKEFLIPVMTPFTADDKVDHDALYRLTQAGINAGADGIYAGGSSAECFLLSVEERKAVLETVVAAAAGKKVVAHIGALGTKLASDLAVHAAKTGVTAISSVPPFYFHYTLAELQHYYRALTDVSGLPLMIYYIQARTGYTLSLDDLRALFENERITAIKFTDKDYYLMERVKTLTGATVYSGCDECCLAGLTMGADGAIGTTFNYMLEKYLRMAACIDNGDLAGAGCLQTSANYVIEALVRTNVITGSKYLAKRKGIDMKIIAREPFAPLSDDDCRLLDRVFDEYIGE